MNSFDRCLKDYHTSCREFGGRRRNHVLHWSEIGRSLDKIFISQTFFYLPLHCHCSLKLSTVILATATKVIANKNSYACRGTGCSKYKGRSDLQEKCMLHELDDKSECICKCLLNLHSMIHSGITLNKYKPIPSKHIPSS
jgi:hypothetical protein